MFPELNNLLDIDVDRQPSSQCILVRESEGANGGFVLANLLSLSLRGNAGVCFVGFAQTFHHYKCIAAKMSLNLVRFQEVGRLVFIEALKSIGKDLIQAAKLLSSESDLKCTDELTYQQPNKAGNEFLKKQFFAVKESIEKLPSDVPTVLIIDDCSILTSIGCRDIDVSVWFQYLRTFVCSRGGTVVTLVQHSLDVSADEPGLLVRHLSHSSDILIDVRRLRTGYCRELHGEISVQWKAADGAHSKCKPPRTMHFKLGDKTVSLFPPGMSSAVL